MRQDRPRKYSNKFGTFLGLYYLSATKQNSLMKKVLLILLSALGLGPVSATAQNIVLGERVPELKAQSWLDDRQPAPAPVTYVEFYHSSNPSCVTSLERLKELTGKLGTKLRVIVVTKEDAAKIAPLLRPYLSKQITAVLNAEKGFTAFGVTYVPFGVLIDAKNRALWMGNSLQINEKMIEQSIR